MLRQKMIGLAAMIALSGVLFASHATTPRLGAFLTRHSNNITQAAAEGGFGAAGWLAGAAIGARVGSAIGWIGGPAGEIGCIIIGCAAGAA